MNRAAFPALLIALALGGGLVRAGARPDSEARERFGTADATAIESVLAEWYPRSTVEWALESVTLVTAQGERRKFQVSGFVRRAVGQRYFMVTCVDFPDQTEPTRRRVTGFDRPAASSSKMIVAAAWTLPDGAIDGTSRRVDVPVSGDVATCRTLDLEGAVAEGAWPTVRIAYGSAFSGAGWWGWIDWRASLDVATGRLRDVLPLRANKTWRDGATALRFVTATTPGAAREESAAQLRANPLVLELTCDKLPCETNGRALLERIGK